MRTQRHMDLRLDEDGHLASAEDWSERVAEHLAAASGIELGANHWRVLRALRSFHAATGVAPSMRPLVKLLREHGDADLASSIALLELFPSTRRLDSPAVVAARIAGLPRPDKCLRAPVGARR